MSIEVKDLTHTYMPDSPMKATAIHHVTAAIGPQEFVGLIGHTGSGKSTLIQHFNGLLKPTSGTVLVDGIDLNASSTDLKAVRMRVGLVFQYPEYQLFEETVKKDIAFGPKNMGLSDDEIDARVIEAARLVGLTEETMERSPFELSGGQKRRVAIAGVIAMRPQVLILDEPVAGLDPKGREEMLQLLKNLHETQKNALVMVSHSMNDVARFCTRVLVMNQGELVFDGTPREIFRHADELIQMGLGIPDGLALSKRLREAGFALPEDIWTTEEIARAIIGQLRGGEAS